MAQLPVVPLPQLSAGGTTPQTLGARFWWVASDLTTNVNVTNWVDRIQSFVLTNGADSLRPTNSATGVGFDGTHWLSNNPVFDWETSAAGTASVWIVFSPVTAPAANGGLLTSDASSGFFTTSGNQAKTFGDKGNGTIYNFVSGTTYDLTMTISNNAGQQYNFTNNVFINTFIGGQPNRSAGRSNQLFVGQGGTYASPSLFYKGKLIELVYFYSNITPATISQLHTYATNRYGFSP